MWFLDRLFRVFGRLRLWHQFALLGLFMVTFPIGLTARSFLSDGSRILTDHEIVDLADEANLRVTEFRDEVDAVSQRMARTGREVSRQLTGAGPKPDPLTPAVADAALTGVVHQWAANPLPAGQPAESVAQLRHRYFADALDLAVALRVAPGRPVVIAAVVPPGRTALDARPDGGATVRGLLDDLAARVTREDAGYVSKLAPEPVGDGKPPRCLVAVGRPARWEGGRPTDVLAVVLDFGRYLEARSRVSPRHLFLVADPAGNLLFAPDPATAARGGPVAAAIPWMFPDDAWAKPEGLPADRDRRAAAVLQQGGLRLKGAVAPAYRFFYRKGEFGGSPGKPLEEVFKEAAGEKAGKLNALLAEEAKAAGGLAFRYGEVRPSSTYIELSHRSQDELKQVSDRVDGWWKAAGGPGGVSWSAPLKCETFQGQLTYLRLDPGADDEPARLITAAALEELREDIETQFWWNVWRVVLPTVLVASLLTSLVVVALTGSLRRLARSAQKATDPAAPPTLVGGGCLEVTLLAKALREMAARLRTDAARYSAILRAAGEGIVVASGDGAIEEANRAAAKMFGYPKPEDLVGRRVGSLIIENLPGGAGAALAAYAAEQEGSGGVSRATPFGDAVRGRRADGTTFWLEVTLRPVNLKDRQLVTCVFRDVSQRKQAEEDIRRMNEELDTRVKVRTAELAEANTKLEVALRHAEAAAKAKDAFVANMSHELRQPLHIIIGFTEALKEEAEDTGTTSLVPDLNKILAAAKHLLDLINDILDLAKIAAGKMELSVGPCDINQLVDDVRLLVGPLAEKNGNTFLVDAPAGLGQMATDDRRVKQMLINLLSNAFKFTTKGTVRLVVRRATEGGRGWVRFAVADNGKGMTPEQVNQLGKQFFQADASTTREQGGTGLGLSICRAFNDLLGGRPMRVTSTPGHGSEFVLLLPADAALQDSGKHAPPAEAARSWATAGLPDAATASTWTWSSDKAVGPPTRGTVLVIDDDPMVRELMARFLTKEGFQVRTADNGPAGLALAREVKPAAITLDVMMPGTDGWQVLTELKADRDTCDIPVVLLTIVDDRGRGYALGAADYLTKPIDWPRLGAILRRYHPPGGDRPVLVVDDDPHCRELVRRHLEAGGYRVTEAADGEQGLREVAREAPALVLLDLMMPNVDGFAFLDEFPKRFPGGRVPVLVLTAKDLTAADFDRLNGRVASILEKGDLSRLDELVGLIRRLAKRATAPAP